MLRCRDHFINFMRWLPGRHKDHLRQVKGSIHFFSSHKMTIMYRVEGPSKYPDTPHVCREPMIFQRFIYLKIFLPHRDRDGSSTLFIESFIDDNITKKYSIRNNDLLSIANT